MSKLHPPPHASLTPPPLPHCLINCTVVGVFLFCCCCWFSFGWRFNSLNVDAMLSTAEMRSGRCCSKSCGFLSRCPGPSLPPCMSFFPPPACSCLFFPFTFYAFCSLFLPLVAFHFVHFLFLMNCYLLGLNPTNDALERASCHVFRNISSYYSSSLPNASFDPILTSYTSCKLFGTHVRTSEQ